MVKLQDVNERQRKILTIIPFIEKMVAEDNFESGVMFLKQKDGRLAVLEFIDDNQDISMLIVSVEHWKIKTLQTGLQTAPIPGTEKN